MYQSALAAVGLQLGRAEIMLNSASSAPELKSFGELDQVILTIDVYFVLCCMFVDA